MFSAETVPTILNVDDHEICRYAISRLLEQSNFRVREAATGTEALQTARREQPDLVLLDVHLPDIDGYEVCRRLKAEPATARIPVVHISATYLSGSDRARGLEAGADGYLTEPVEPEVLIATIRAILRARRAEESARNAAVEWQATFDAISDGVAVVDAGGRIQRSNAALARLLGRPGAELTGALCYRLWEEADERKFPFFRALENRRRETVEWEHGLRLLSITVDPIFERESQTAGAVCIFSDVTETRRLEEQFRESQKFETIGTLAAGVAHDYNNLLTSIMGNASLALGEQPEGSPVRERLQEVVRASQRAADLTRQLLAYSGKGRHFLQKADLSDLVRNTQKLIEAAVPKKIRLEYDLGSRQSIEADVNQIQQALLNLVSNAAEAIGDATGQITVRTGAGEDGKVFLEVRDTGCGMDAATRSRIFDPFFTTKFTGRGLGLAAVAGIVRGHRAAIEVTSTPREGSAFRITFPAAAERAPAPPPAAAAHEVGATVLVVDDEEMVRRVAQATLEANGWRVLVANDGLAAIEQVREHPEIGLILLDLTMPVMNGEEALDQILEVRSGVKVIVSTGYGNREATARFGTSRVAGFLQKPYTARQLAETVRTVSAAGRTRSHAD